MENGSLMEVETIAECSKGSILQYFRPALSYIVSLEIQFSVFLSCRLRHAHSGFSSLMHSMLPKDTLLRTYLL